MTALRAGWISCHDCGRLTSIVSAADGAERCPRCHAPLHARKPGSLSRTWAFLLAACCLIGPANTYPVLHFESFGRESTSTIVSGVIELLEHGEPALAAVVFIASVMVPLLKILGLAFLLVSIHLRLRWGPRQRTKLFRMIEFVGRWSMLDIFVITVLVALVQVGAIATILPGVGALSFAAVVVFTMLASSSFDPRLIWDVMELRGE